MSITKAQAYCLGLATVICIWGYTIFLSKLQAAAHEHPDPPRIEAARLPQRCAHLLDPGNTDPNSPWKRCMLVGVTGK